MSNYLHLHSQPGHHQAAWIVGHREALTKLRDTLNKVLESGEAQGMQTFATDGEGYAAIVIPVVEGDLESLQLPYNGGYAVTSDRLLGKAPYALLNNHAHYLRLMRGT